METALKIMGVGFPPMSARNCTQTLAPISSGKYVRSLMGNLCFIGPNKNIKYRSVIEGEDQTPPSFEDLRYGSLLRVSCLQHLWQTVSFETQDSLDIFLNRPMVPGTLHGRLEDGQPLNIQEIGVGRVQVTAPTRGPKGYLIYRPELWMQLIDFSIIQEDWAPKTKWRFVLEEN
jgi:hypothetical protein